VVHLTEDLVQYLQLKHLSHQQDPYPSIEPVQSFNQI